MGDGDIICRLSQCVSLAHAGEQTHDGTLSLAKSRQRLMSSADLYGIPGAGAPGVTVSGGDVCVCVCV